MKNHIEYLKQTFTVTNAVFNAVETIQKALTGRQPTRHPMHQLHITMLIELEKENPNIETIDTLFELMEDIAESNKSNNED